MLYRISISNFRTEDAGCKTLPDSFVATSPLKRIWDGAFSSTKACRSAKLGHPPSAHLLLGELYRFLRVLNGGDDILGYLRYELFSPKWVGELVVDHPDVPNIEGYVCFV